MPERIRLQRTKGWRKPEGAIVVARPSKWGNPFPVAGGWAIWTAVALGYQADRPGRHAMAVALYRAWMTGEPIVLGDGRLAGSGSLVFSDGTERTLDEQARGLAALAASLEERPTVPERPDLEPLRGHDLACWCPEGLPCHGTVLLELANA